LVSPCAAIHCSATLTGCSVHAPARPNHAVLFARPKLLSSLADPSLHLCHRQPAQLRHTQGYMLKHLVSLSHIKTGGPINFPLFDDDKLTTIAKDNHSSSPFRTQKIPPQSKHQKFPLSRSDRHHEHTGIKQLTYLFSLLHRSLWKTLEHLRKCITITFRYLGTYSSPF
jgi:hypothetical protein